MRSQARLRALAHSSTTAARASAHPVSAFVYEVYVARVYSTVTVSVSVAPLPPLSTASPVASL